MKHIEIRHAHMFCGLGGGAKGFNNGRAEVGSLKAKFRCIGGVDVDAASIRDFRRLAGVPGTVMDLFSREQYIAFHGSAPPAGWKEATPSDIRGAYSNESPHILFLSAPCKGFSGLLSEARSRTDKYQALNKLTLRGVWLAMEAWKDDPPEFVLFENVPRIQNRGRHLLDQIVQLLQHYGYATRETTHDCGELGNLGQSRKRFLLVARHQEKVPAFLYEPPKRPLRAVGEVLERFPLPGNSAAGPMHRMPALHWKTWVRLAFVEAGSDWRSLQKLRIADGVLADYLIVPEYHGGYMGVIPWRDHVGTITSRSSPSTGKFAVADPRTGNFKGGHGVVNWKEPSGTIAGESFPTNGAFSVADPRIDGHPKSVQHGVLGWDETAGVVTGKMFVGGGPHAVADPRFDPKRYDAGQYGVRKWTEPTGTVTSQRSPGQGEFSVADPRVPGTPYNHVDRIVAWDAVSPAVTSANGGTAAAVADPRCHGGFDSKYRVTPFDAPAGTVIGGSTTGQGAFAIADPRPACLKRIGDDYLTGGHYGVLSWDSPSYCVSGVARHDNGPWSVADPRMPAASDRLVALIRALDGTWHRPFTTLELAALQGLIDAEEYLELEGLSDSAWRERIGNAVPPPAAAAIASVIGRAILGAWTGETFLLSSEPVWVQPIAVAVAVNGSGLA